MVVPRTCRAALFPLLWVPVLLSGCFSAADEGNADALFDLDRLHHFDIELEPDDWMWLNDNPLLEEYRPATVVFEGERYGGAGLRFKGGFGSLESCFDDTGAQICPKLSLKVSFNGFTDGGRFFGLRKLVFNSSVRDPSLMREVIGYKLFRDMGISAPRASHATVAVNGEPLGLFVFVEQVDKEFVEDHFANDSGNLYKSVWPIHENPESYIEALRTNEDTPDVSGMLEFHDLIESATDDSFVDDMAGVLDLDQFAAFLAVDRAIDNSDGPSAFYCYGSGSTDCESSNYYWYEQPGGMRTLVPWDLDYALTDTNDLGRAYNDPNPDGCAPVAACLVWGDPNCDPATEEVFLLPSQCDKLYGMVHRATWARYLDELARLADGPLARDVRMEWMDAVRDKIRAAVADDPFGPGVTVFDDENSWVDEVLDIQAAEIETLLSEPLP